MRILFLLGLISLQVRAATFVECARSNGDVIRILFDETANAPWRLAVDGFIYPRDASRLPRFEAIKLGGVTELKITQADTPSGPVGRSCTLSGLEKAPTLTETIFGGFVGLMRLPGLPCTVTENYCGQFLASQ